jgi:ferric-dicitrate binding protein FerR (iron transport regulator)
MDQKKWDLLAKHLAKETNEFEEIEFSNLIDTDVNFKNAYNDSAKLWNELKIDRTDFDHTRIKNLRDQKINLESKRKRNKIITLVTRYAAILIGVLVGVSLIYKDLNSTITYAESGDVVLPDGSKITLNKNATITHNNSILKSFDREVKVLAGNVFFDVSKQNGENFVVKTGNFNIEVLGTKFNVSNSSTKTSVVLEEGKILLHSYSKDGIDNMELEPGDEVVFGYNFTTPQLRKVNTEVSKFWMKSKLDFDNYSLQDLKSIFVEYYGKNLVINNKEIGINKIGGSAPVDDINLIIKGLSMVLKQDLVIRNDSIIIN